jgi:hypothetical protein
MNILIDILKNGYSYSVNTSTGDIEQVHVPPSRYTIQAASELIRMQNVLVNLNTAIEQERALNASLHADCEQYRKTIKEMTNAANSAPVSS